MWFSECFKKLNNLPQANPNPMSYNFKLKSEQKVIPISLFITKWKKLRSSVYAPKKYRNKENQLVRTEYVTVDYYRGVFSVFRWYAIYSSYF